MSEPFERPASRRPSRTERARRRMARRATMDELAPEGTLAFSGGEVAMALLAGLLAGAGLRLDALALLVAAALVAPRLRPLYALAHQTLRGSWIGIRAALAALGALLGAFMLGSFLSLIHI